MARWLITTQPAVKVVRAEVLARATICSGGGDCGKSRGGDIQGDGDVHGGHSGAGGGGRDGTAQKTAITSMTMSVVEMMMKAMEAEASAQRQQKQ